MFKEIGSNICLHWILTNLGTWGDTGRSCDTKILSQVETVSCLFTQKVSIWPRIERGEEDMLVKLIANPLLPKKELDNSNEFIIPNLKM